MYGGILHHKALMLAIMGLLLEKRILSVEDFGDIRSITALSEVLLSRKVISQEDLEKVTKESRDLLKGMARVLRRTPDSRQIFLSLRFKYGDKYPKLFEFIEGVVNEG